MATLTHINCFFVMAVIFMASAAHIPNSNNPNIPWAHPCMPNGQLTKVNPHSVEADSKITYLIDKAENTLALLNDLLEFLEEKIADPKITNSLHMVHIAGFPKVNHSVKQQDVFIYSDHFSQLSKVAVFLEKIQDDIKDEDLKFGLEDLFTENLRQMCELHIALAKQRIQLPDPAPRSIIPQASYKPESSFDYYTRDYQIMYEYRLLLKSHLAEYQQIKNNSQKSHLV